MVVSGVARSKRCTGLPRSSSSTRAIVAPGRTDPERPRRAAARSASGAPQVAQNLIPGGTGEAHRGQLGPEPGAVSRRPQWGQYGCSALARPPQNGQETGSLWSRASAERATTRVPGTGVAPCAVSRSAPPPPPPLPPPHASAFRPRVLSPGVPPSLPNRGPRASPRPPPGEGGLGGRALLGGEVMACPS